MAVNLGLDVAYLNWVGTEAATFRAMDGETVLATYAVANALRRALSRNEIAAVGGLFTTQDIAWNLPAAQLADSTPAGGGPASPKEGDRITAASDGSAWRVLDVQLLTKRSRWRLVCRRER